MFPCVCSGYGFWWLFPIIMIGMMVLCFFMMRGRMGSMCRPGFRGIKEDGEKSGMDRRD